MNDTGKLAIPRAKAINCIADYELELVTTWVRRAKGPDGEQQQQLLMGNTISITLSDVTFMKKNHNGSLKISALIPLSNATIIFVTIMPPSLCNGL